jgi:hypothetical protein
MFADRNLTTVLAPRDDARAVRDLDVGDRDSGTRPPSRVAADAADGRPSARASGMAR